MNEYIDREALHLAFDEFYFTNKKSLRETIDFVPAADVVEVVRCKDCAIPHNRWTGCPRMNGTIMEPDDYCSNGERKEANND